MKPFDAARRSLGEGPSAARRTRQRAHLLQRTVLAGGRASHRGWRLAPVALAAVAATAVLWALWRTPAPAAGMQLTGATTPELRFAEGSTLALADDTAARLDVVDDARVEVTLERGTLSAHVQKGTGRTWRYHAGPWVVRVVGTRLRITYSPEAASVDVGVTEGAVEVTGPGGLTRVLAGETLRRTAGPPALRAAPAAAEVPPEGTLAPHASEASAGEDAGAPEAVDASVAPGRDAAGGRPAAAEVPSQGTPAPHAAEASAGEHAGAPEVVDAGAAPGRDAAGGGPAPGAPPRHRVAAPAPRPPSWRALLSAGSRTEALTAAQRDGLFEHPEALSTADALWLADAARLEQQPALARALLAGVHEVAGEGAAEAAYLLGRLEADAKQLAHAREAFARSLAADARGAFAEQARGRLLEVLLELEDLPAARRAARDYLQHHPTGAWARLARGVPGGPPP